MAKARGRGAEKGGLLGPPLDVKALKGPGNSAPLPGPASRLPLSQSAPTLDVRPSQLLQMFPGQERSLPGGARRFRPGGKGCPSPYTETLSRGWAWWAW